MRKWNDWGDNESVLKILHLIEDRGFSVHVRRLPPMLDSSDPVAVEIYAVRSTPRPVCQIVDVGDDPEHGEYLAALQLAEALGIPVISELSHGIGQSAS